MLFFVFVKDENGNTAIQNVSNGEHLEVVKLLIEKGADDNVQDKNGKTASIKNLQEKYLQRDS
jgi:ankyrin repeat protein